MTNSKMSFILSQKWAYKKRDDYHNDDHRVLIYKRLKIINNITFSQLISYFFKASHFNTNRTV